MKRGERAEGVDADVRIRVGEQRPQAIDRGPRSKTGTVHQRFVDAARRDGADLEILVPQRKDQLRRPRSGAQPRQGEEGMPAHRCVGCVCKPHQVGDGRARAEPPCLEQRLIHDPGQRRRRAGREDINQCARALLSPDLGDRRHGFELWQRDIGHANRAHGLLQGGNRPRVFLLKQRNAG